MPRLPSLYFIVYCIVAEVLTILVMVPLCISLAYSFFVAMTIGILAVVAVIVSVAMSLIAPAVVCLLNEISKLQKLYSSEELRV